METTKQILDLSVGELRTFDTGGRPDTLDRGDLAEGSEFPGRKAAYHAPLPLELIQLGDEPEHLGSDG